MDFARYAITRPVNIWILVLTCLLGGILAFFEIGRLEDPSFTLKNAMVITSYPGASPQQVEEEVSYPLENAIQQLPSIKKVTSISSAGLSQISLELHSQYKAEQIPQIWDELRRKINDLQPNLPPGVNPPQVRDDFSDVFGFFLLLIVDSVVLNRKIKRTLAERFPAGTEKVRGASWYGISRATMIRRWRFPKPEVPVGADV